MWLVSSQRGSAVVDFVLVAFPLLAIFSATVSISLGSYARLVLIDATIEGARYASLADQNLEAGVAKTKNLVTNSLGSALSVEVTGKTLSSGNLEIVRLDSKLALTNWPELRFLSASSVATREVEY